MVRKRLCQVVVVVLLLSGAVALSQSPAFAESVGPLEIYGLASNKCIDDPENSMSNNQVMDIYTCLETTNEQFYIEGVPDNHVWIVNVKSGKCLTVQNALMTNNAPIIQYTCTYGGNEEWDRSWVYVQKYGLVFTIVNAKSGRCITIQNLGTTNNSKLLQFDCNQGENQLWAQENLI
jgi:hypothetical protein